MSVDVKEECEKVLPLANKRLPPGRMNRGIPVFQRVAIIDKYDGQSNKVSDHSILFLSCLEQCDSWLGH